MIRFSPQKEGKERLSLDLMPLCERAQECDALPTDRIIVSIRLDMKEKFNRH